MSKLFAVIDNNAVVNVVVADTLEIAEEVTQSLCVESTEDNKAHIGLGYSNGLFEQPEIIEVTE